MVGNVVRVSRVVNIVYRDRNGGEERRINYFEIPMAFFLDLIFVNYIYPPPPPLLLQLLLFFLFTTFSIRRRALGIRKVDVFHLGFPFDSPNPFWNYSDDQSARSVFVDRYIYYGYYSPSTWWTNKQRSIYV